MLAVLLISSAACTSSDPLRPLAATQIAAAGGNGQMGQVSATLADPLTVLATDAAGNAVPDVTVSWSVVSGGGSVTPSSTTNSSGLATAVFTLGATLGEQSVQAQAGGLTAVVFTATSVAAGTGLSVVGGGDNVPERFSSDLWVHGNYAYSGTWGFREEEGNTLKVWSLDAGGAPTLVGSVTVPDIGTVSDVQVSEDGQLLVLSGERGPDGGIYLYSSKQPGRTRRSSAQRWSATQASTPSPSSNIAGRLYAFAARNPGFPGVPRPIPRS